MSFRAADLSVLAYANNFTLWHYTTPDKDVTDDNHFGHACDMLRVNDLMIVNTDSANAEGSTTKFYLVTGNTGDKVTITLYS